MKARVFTPSHSVGTDRLRQDIVHDLRLLLRLHTTPPTAGLVIDLMHQRFPHCLALSPNGLQGHAALAAVEGALNKTATHINETVLRGLAQDHTALYHSPAQLDGQGRLRRSGDRVAQALNVMARLAAAPGHAGFYETAAFLDRAGLTELDAFAQWSRTQNCGPFYPALAALTAAYAHDLHGNLEKIVSKPRPYLASARLKA